MPKPRYPSKIDPLSFPVFGLNWWANPGTGDNVVSYCGGGGSAKTGVTNKIVVRINDDPPLEISTGDDVCVQVTVWQDYRTNEIMLFGAIGSSVKRFALPSGQVSADIAVKDCGGTNVVAVNALGTRMGVGCESGDVHVFHIEGDTFSPIHLLKGHEKAVCSLSFALRSPLLLSSAKDGTARVWLNDQAVDTMTCDVSDPKTPPPKKPPQVLVRGTAFGDLEGKLVYTVASGRRGQAYLSKWISHGSSYMLDTRTEIHPCPVSAMNLSGDASLLALGGVDGTIVLFDVMTWKPIKKWMEVHELPVTCIAARPYPTPSKGDQDGMMYHAISASADSQLGVLTLMRSGPTKKREAGASSGGETTLPWFTVVFWTCILLSILYTIAQEAMDMCSMDLSMSCVMNEVLIAPSSRPGILVPPH
jgi:WD40 repeat protein